MYRRGMPPGGMWIHTRDSSLRARRSLRTRSDAVGRGVPVDADDFYLICGLGRVGARVLEYLQAAGMRAAVVDFKVDPGDPSLRGAPALRGDFRQLDVLRQAGLDRAKGVLILSSDDLA